ncbi:hypothetical protein MTR_7g109570 [Medicago truncatula]|uniref:Uncharacterized protein n=1 Tax=Medicago truncatula TaxID=3880 RepID=G7KSU1_MEDTR|nr:hypothetical protein MTR_7g109570 [Medicago truncatula]
MFYNISKPLQEEDSCFKKGRNLTTDTYTDYNYASLMNDRRSTSSYYVFLCGNLVIKWEGPIKHFSNNKSAINIAHNLVQHDRKKK